MISARKITFISPLLVCKLPWNSASRSQIYERGNVFKFYSQDTVCFSQWEDWHIIRNIVEPAPECLLLARQQLFCGYYRVLLFFVSAPSKYKILYTSTTGICFGMPPDGTSHWHEVIFHKSLAFVKPSLPISKLRRTLSTYSCLWVLVGWSWEHYAAWKIAL